MTARASRPDLEDLRARYLAAQLSGDRREAMRIVIVDGLERGVSVRELSDDVVGGAQREIGALWQRNELSIVLRGLRRANGRDVARVSRRPRVVRGTVRPAHDGARRRDVDVRELHRVDRAARSRPHRRKRPTRAIELAQAATFQKQSRGAARMGSACDCCGLSSSIPVPRSTERPLPHRRSPADARCRASTAVACFHPHMPRRPARRKPHRS